MQKLIIEDIQATKVDTYTRACARADWPRRSILLPTIISTTQPQLYQRSSLRHHYFYDYFDNSDTAIRQLATTTAMTTSTTQTRRYGSSCLLPSTTQTSRLIAALTAPACMPRWKREHRAAAHACATQNLLQTHYMYVQDYQRTSSSCQLVYMSIAQGSNKDEAATTSVSRRSLLLHSYFNCSASTTSPLLPVNNSSLS